MCDCAIDVRLSNTTMCNHEHNNDENYCTHVVFMDENVTPPKSVLYGALYAGESRLQMNMHGCICFIDPLDGNLVCQV